jgi:hypothetical protein
MTTANILRIILILLLLLILIFFFVRLCGPHHGGPIIGGAGPGDCNDTHLALFPSGIQTTIWSDGTVALTLPIENQGEHAASDVQLTQFDIQTGSRLTPASLPLALGEIVPDNVHVVDAHFKFPSTGSPLAVTASGTYHVASHACTFDIATSINPQPPNNSPIPSTPVSTLKFNPSTVTYPPPPPPNTGEREFNGTGVRAPQGEPRNLFPTPPSATGVQKVAPGSLGQPQPLPPGASPGNAVEIVTNTGGGPYGGFPPDPDAAGANPTQIAMYTANTGVSYSIDNGKTFTTVNLTSLVDPTNPARTSFFPQSDGGVCCDQSVIYVPSVNIFVWLLQYWPAPIGTSGGKTVTGPNRLRIAWATPAAIKSDFIHAWTYTDLTSATFGIGNDWMDYPDISFSDKYLYVGVDHGLTNTGSVYSQRRIVDRMSLSDMVGPGSTVGGSAIQPTYNGIFQNHFIQNSHDTMFWSALPDTSTLAVFSWPDSSNSASIHTVNISSYSNSNFTVNAPDNQDWDTAPQSELGGARTQIQVLCPPGGTCPPSDFLYFAFSAGITTGRPYPYVRVEKINTANFSLISELDIWNSSYAFATAALGSPLNGGNDEVSISLATGGGGNYANNAVGFLNDFVVYVTTDSTATQTAYNLDSSGNIVKNSSGNPTYHTRYGDYFDARDSYVPTASGSGGSGYATLGYAIQQGAPGKNCAQTGCSTNLHYIIWGRPGELNPVPPPPPK